MKVLDFPLKLSLNLFKPILNKPSLYRLSLAKPSLNQVSACHLKTSFSKTRFNVKPGLYLGGLLPCLCIRPYVCFIARNMVPKSMTLTEIEEATLADDTLQKVIELIQNGKWYTIDKCNNAEEIKPFAKIKSELSVADKPRVVLRDQRIVIPKALQQRSVEIAHEGHFGLVRTKAIVREKIWFPQLDSTVESMIKDCLACQATTTLPKPREPLQMTPMPKKAWTHLAADFYGPLPTGEHLLVIIDEHSRYPVVEIVHSTSANTVIPILDKVFAMFGTPECIKTDNGPPWQSDQIRNFADHLGFRHRKITPFWPEGNAEAERFVRVIGKTLKAAKIESHPWKQALNQMLRNYRSSSHCTTGCTPASLMFGREVRTKLPQYEMPKQNQEARSKKAQTRDKKQKAKMKAAADKQRSSSHLRLISVGDKVLVRQTQTNKLSPPYKPQAYIVSKKKGSMITAINNSL